MKQYQGFTLIQTMIVLTIVATSFLLLGRAYKSYQVRKDTILLAESVRTIAQIVIEQNSGSLLYNVDPDAVSINKNIPSHLSYNTSSNVFVDKNNTSIFLSALTSGFVSRYTQLSDVSQGFLVRVNFDGSNNGVAKCSNLINTMINDFKIIQAAAATVRNVDEYYPIDNNCNRSNPHVYFLHY